MASNEMLCLFLACHTILAMLVQLEIVEIALVKTETPKSVLPFPMQCFIIHIIIYPTIFFTKLRCRSLLHSQLRCFQSKNWFVWCNLLIFLILNFLTFLIGLFDPRRVKCLLVQIPKCKSNSNGLGFKTSLTDVQKKEVLPTLVRSPFLSPIWTNVNFDGKTRPPPDRCTTRPQTCSLGQLAAARGSAGEAAAAEMYFSKELFSCFCFHYFENILRR